MSALAAAALAQHAKNMAEWLRMQAPSGLAGRYIEGPELRAAAAIIEELLAERAQWISPDRIELGKFDADGKRR